MSQRPKCWTALSAATALARSGQRIAGCEHCWECGEEAGSGPSSGFPSDRVIRQGVEDPFLRLQGPFKNAIRCEGMTSMASRHSAGVGAYCKFLVRERFENG